MEMSEIACLQPVRSWQSKVSSKSIAMLSRVFFIVIVFQPNVWDHAFSVTVMLSTSSPHP